jgi:hypothetical protein
MSFLSLVFTQHYYNSQAGWHEAALAHLMLRCHHVIVLMLCTERADVDCAFSSLCCLHVYDMFINGFVLLSLFIYHSVLFNRQCFKFSHWFAHTPRFELLVTCTSLWGSWQQWPVWSHEVSHAHDFNVNFIHFIWHNRALQIQFARLPWHLIFSTITHFSLGFLVLFWKFQLKNYYAIQMFICSNKQYEHQNPCYWSSVTVCFIVGGHCVWDVIKWCNMGFEAGRSTWITYMAVKLIWFLSFRMAHSPKKKSVMT